MQLAKQQAAANNMPLSVLLPGNIKIDVMGLEDGKIVYSVITNFAHPTIGARMMFYDELITNYDLSKGYIYYGNGIIIDNTHGLFDPQISERGTGPVLLIPDSGQDRIVMVSLANGDVLDPSFFPPGTFNFSTPKKALLTPRATILVSDQINDAIYEYDTTGTYLRIFAPVGGVNTNIMENVRDIVFKGNTFNYNGNILAAISQGGNANTIQEFDTAGNNIGTYLSGPISGPFCFGFRAWDIIISCGVGTPKLHRFSYSGTFLGSLGGSDVYGTMQQMVVSGDNSFIVACLTGTYAGLVKFDSSGNRLGVLNGVTTNYGVHRLQNGNYITSNPSGIHEIDDVTGTLVRTIMPMTGQYFSIYDPDMLLSVPNNTGIVPSQYKLYSNYPNPFNPSTKIKFAIPNNGITKVVVYNSLGKEVSVLVNRFHTAGEYEYNFDASGLSSGVYFYTLTSGDFRGTKKMLLLK